VENSFEVEPGRGKAFNKTSSVVVSQPAAKPSSFDNKILDAPTAQTPYWRSQMQVPGTYSFRITLRRPVPLAKKRAKWIVNFVDSKNYIEYEIDEKMLKYTIHQNGREQSGPSVAHSGSDADFCDVVIDIAASSVNVSIKGQHVPIATPGGNLLTGTFAFPNAEIWTNFQFSVSK
jgi:hypothetical protein